MRGETPAVGTDEGVSILDVASDTRRKAAFLQRKPFVEQAEIYRLAKGFFKAYLKKPYEFTGAELRQELHKVYLPTIVRERVDGLIEKLSLLEYTDTQYSQAELKLLLQEIASIVKALVVEHQKSLPFLTRLANWLFRKRPKKAESYISDYPVLESQDHTGIEMNMLLEDIYDALGKGKTGRAVKLYKQLSKRYGLLGSTAQQRFYHRVQAAYDEILKQP